MRSDNPVFNVVRARRTVRRFSQRDVEEELLFELIELANRAPSGFNLQPWHFILIRSDKLKPLLHYAAMDQRQLLEAPALVAFVADPDAWKQSYSRVLDLSLSSGALSQEVAAVYRKSVSLLFRLGPFGLFGFFKKFVTPLLRLKKPMPSLISDHGAAAHYVREQTMLAAATFMLAAKGVNLDTCPMEGFDEERVKRILAVPKNMTVPLIIAVGYPLDVKEAGTSVRIPFEEKTSLDVFGNTLDRIFRGLG